MNKPSFRSACLAALIAMIVLIACDAGSETKAKWVVDGDTIFLTDGRSVRYIGIDTPEIDTKKGDAEPMGAEARAMNRRLVDGWTLRLTYDREKRDRYGRTLAYVHRADGLFVNAELLERGVAHVLYHFPNTGQSDRLLGAQRKAMQRGVGIWQTVDKQAIPSHSYWGNRRSMRFHAHDCPNARTIAPKNRVRFSNRWDAFWLGYAPASQCISFPQ